MKIDQTSDQQPVVERLADFDRRSGSLLERALFNHRWVVIGLCVLVTGVLGWQATRLRLNASFEKMIPTQQPFIVNYLKHKEDLGGLGNSIRIAVETTRGTIFNKQYLATLKSVNDAVFLLPGVNRPFMKSLWTSTTRWFAITKDGMDGGAVMPDHYDGSPPSIQQVRANVQRSAEIGRLVANNFKSSVIYVPLTDVDPQTGRPLDYDAFNQRLNRILAQYRSDTIRFHVIGFARLMGDLLAGLRQVLAFFLVAVVIAAAVLFWYTRCVRSTLLVVSCSLVAVVWQLGLISLLGYTLDPYSILAPFLVFAIGMSHGAQKMNGIMQDVGRGTHRVVAARYTFRRLFVAGLTALLCDAVGFAVLAIIRIRAIQDLAEIASIGVAILIFTNLILLPILLSYVGVSATAAARSLRAEVNRTSKHWLWRVLDRFTQRRWATVAVVGGVALATVGFALSRHLQVGDLDPGAPELRPNSRYNRDVAFFTRNYSVSSDVFVVMVTTPPDHCSDYAVESKVDALSWRLDQLPGVQSTNSLAKLTKLVQVSYDEGNFKWYELVPNEGALAGARSAVQNLGQLGMFNQNCSLLELYAYLQNHKAATLSAVVQTVQVFATNNDTPTVHFEMAAGNAGIEAATNIVVKQALNTMLLWVYGAVILLSWITFRSWRGVLVAVLPLVLTSILGEALMVLLGMGVKVATLPVVALGVGIGVDYALYVLSVTLAHLRNGKSLSDAYYQALIFTGKVVMLTGITLAVAVATWVFSPIKFQADMGTLLAFMFLWNMLGALVLLPALAYFIFRGQRRPAAVDADLQ